MDYLLPMVSALQLLTATGTQINFPLVPHGSEYGDSFTSVEDDTSTSLISLSVSFPYFGTNETGLYVNTNGYLSFGSDFNDFTPKNFSQVTAAMIAPYWIDIDIRQFGNISYRTLAASEPTSNLQQIISSSFAISNFELRLVFVLTYYQVPPFRRPQVFPAPNNSFQAVLVTDGDLSFVLFSYGDIQWGSGANIGFNSGNRSFMLPEALTPATENIETTSNVGIPGLYVYRVDKESIVGPNNFTAVDVLLTPSKPLPVLLGDYITLTCSVEKSQNSTYQYCWFHNNSTLHEQTTTTLKLPVVQAKDLGVYKCTVYNNNTFGSTTLHLYTTDGIERGPYPIQITSSCSSQQGRDDITKDVFQLLSREFGVRPFGRVSVYPANSCVDIQQIDPDAGNGLYWILSEDGETSVQQYCMF